MLKQYEKVANSDLPTSLKVWLCEVGGREREREGGREGGREREGERGVQLLLPAEHG